MNSSPLAFGVCTRLLVSVLASLVAACGGGGEGGGTPITPPGGGGGAPVPMPMTRSIDPLSGILTLSQPLDPRWTNVNGLPVRVPQGTQASSASLRVGGRTRHYLVIRPDPMPAAAAPMLLLLHARETEPELTANFTYVADFVATQGFWAVLPAAENGVWKAEPADGAADLNFLGALIDTLVAQGVDRERVSVAGYSNGGVMAQRMACEMADRIAAFGMVAATLPFSLASTCAPSVQRPKIYILGTDDPLTPYYGVSGYGSAGDLIEFWAQEQGCAGALSTPVPNSANDGTTVQLDERTGCAGGTALRLYTVDNGGHAWPGGDTDEVGRTSRDISATGLIWSLASAYRR